MTTARQRLTLLREQMKRAKIDAYYVPSVDPHQSEYVPPCWQRRQWLSGFTGSAGDLVITADTAGLWTDGRYFIQAARQLRRSGIKLFRLGRPGVPNITDWLSRTLEPGQALGADPRVLSQQQAENLRQATTAAGAKLRLLERNLVDKIWDERPRVPTAAVETHPTRFSGESVGHKLRRLRRAMRDRGANAHVLTTLDATAWLFNIRGADVEFNPVVISYAIITDRKAQLFCHPRKVPGKVRRALRPEVQVRPYDQFGAALAALGLQQATVWVDPSVNAWVLRKLLGARLINRPSPVYRMKARKNRTELHGARAAHLRDGVAMVRFLHWLSEAVPAGGVTELSAAAQLLAFRAENALFVGESFETISAFCENAAIVHYAATPESDVELRPPGLYLVDSGGQYLDGTTDITRTVLLGDRATREQRDRFTRVLKGHITLARCRFPQGVAGRQIDAFARHALWAAGLDYAHGTGHGVGAYLSVHEGPQSISPVRCTGVALEEGNILSNEPGYYREGHYGIRIENLVAVRRCPRLGHQSPFLRFETLTLCPIDTRLVQSRLLAAGDRRWLNAYHRWVRDELTPFLPGDACAWLQRATRPLRRR